MTVLSDSQIREQMRTGMLVPHGDTMRAQECSYSFLPGRGFVAGDDHEPVEFETSGGPTSITVEPGKMVWIRTSDSVKLPENIVGFWWQTNTLSRKGLMLVNMSMVEPGYTGDLACLFVNFGNGKIIIEPDTVIAKMVFMEIRGSVDHPFESETTTRQYDSKLRELAVNQPGSFLQIGDLATNLAKQRDEAIAEIKLAGADAKAEATREFTLAQSEAINQFKEDAPKAALKALSWAAAGLFILTLANFGATWLKDEGFNDRREVAREEAEKVVKDRITLNAAPASTEAVALRRQVETLNARLAKLEKAK
ncbi:deoxycytidine triphosphate deaminase [Sphingomonas sp. LH128]|uniref:dCTP deaminase n=1 Tax=Sphingomonas sp. LH128 TaxID=473781 RepID=UPI00027CBEFA|nr:deoxycytidine triphosphate deaminase [Sphingomonas sp. LH128]EJU14996.1 deoxycytidine triphosphate deaminase [Sphingomonas sp. LH128]